MRLVADWPRVLVLSLSFWMQIAGLAALIVPEVRYVWTGHDTDPYVMWWLGILLLLAGLAGRVFKQGQSIWREWVRIAAIVAVIIMLAFLLGTKVHAAPPSEEETLAIAVPFIIEKEGMKLKAYIPVKGDVPTICAGSTRGVKLGMTATRAECIARARSEIAEYRAGLHRYFNADTINHRLTPKRDTAYTSLAINCGIAGIGKSTATRRLNAGDITGGCEAIGWWNKFGGRVLRGLVRRRNEEIALCMAGL